MARTKIMPLYNSNAVPTHISRTSSNSNELNSKRQCSQGRTLRAILLLLLFLPGWVLWFFFCWNDSFVTHELEAPFDHLASNLWKPLYSLTCPTLQGIQEVANNLLENQQQLLPPFVMISARPKEQVDPVLQSWTKAGFEIDLVSTANLSANYRNKLCRSYSFKSRLFGIYQFVFDHLLSEQYDHPSPIESWVILEDDVMLLDPEGFREELLYALHHKLCFYSFHKTQPDGCLYQWGTQAQLWSRKMMERTFHVSNDTYCRLPIDMYIAQHGPWYVTQRELVRHVGKRFSQISPYNITTDLMTTTTSQPMK